MKAIDSWNFLKKYNKVIKKIVDWSKEQLYTLYFFIWDFAKLFITMYITYACIISRVPRVQVIEINVFLYIYTLTVILI